MWVSSSHSSKSGVVTLSPTRRKGQCPHWHLEFLSTIAIVFFFIFSYNNPSLGLAIKAKRLQGCRPRGSPGVTSHTFGSVRKCEGVNPRTPRQLPLWEMESRWTLETLESDLRGQNLMSCDFLYIIRKLLERRCLKWARITHLDI